MKPTTPARIAQATEIVRDQRHALRWSALFAIAIICWIVRPIAVGILLGTLAAFVLQPVYERMKPRLGVGWAALVTVLGTMVVLVGVLALLSWAFITRGVGLVHDLFDHFELATATHRFTELVGKVTQRFGFPPSELEARLQALGEEAASRGAALGAEVASASADGLLAVFMALLTMHFFLRNWTTVSLQLEASLPLRKDYSHALFEEFRRAGRTTLLGTVVTGVVQGLLATIGYAVIGVPEPLFFGLGTAIASLVPAVGTMLVWIPVGVVFLLTGHAARGVCELAWGGFIIVGLSDYVIRPRLLGGDAAPPALVTFAALFGGVEVFGLKGLILGPVLMSLALAVLRIYVREASQSADEAARTEATVRESDIPPPT